MKMRMFYCAYVRACRRAARVCVLGIRFRGSGRSCPVTSPWEIWGGCYVKIGIGSRFRDCRAERLIHNHTKPLDAAPSRWILLMHSESTEEVTAPFTPLLTLSSEHVHSNVGSSYISSCCSSTPRPPRCLDRAPCDRPTSGSRRDPCPNSCFDPLWLIPPPSQRLLHHGHRRTCQAPSQPPRLPNVPPVNAGRLGFGR